LDLSTAPPLGLAHFTVLEVPPLELISLAAKIGYAAIGLRLHPAFPGSPFYELPAGSAASREFRRRIDDEGVQVYDIEFVTIAEDFSPSSLTGLLEDASTLGARRLSACGDDSDRSRLVANFGELCEIAAKFGMGVDLECMAWRRVASLPDAISVVAAAARPNGGVLVDALHLSRTGGTPLDLRAAPDGFVRSAQLCDAVAERPSSQEAIIKEARSGRLPPGRGALPLRDLLAELPADTVLSIEVPMDGSTPPEAHARANFEAARNLIAACRSSARRG
jgi:sugar phosphate isomerase/epimerase